MTGPDHLRKLVERATPGPWAQGEGSGQGATTYVYEVDGAGQQHSAIAACFLEGVDRAYTARCANAALIVAAVNALPSLLDTTEEAERLRKRVAELEEGLRPFAEIARGEVWERFIADSQMVLRISNGGGSRHLTFINAECFQVARTLLKGRNDHG